MWTTEAIAASDGSWETKSGFDSDRSRCESQIVSPVAQTCDFYRSAALTQTTAASAEEGAAASEEMNSQAETMRGLVQVLQQMVGQ